MSTKKPLPKGYSYWDDLKRQVYEASTPEEQHEYDAAAAEADAQIALRELVYNMRTKAGITQTELAKRMGTTQPFVSDLERGGRQPTIATLNRVAQATDNRLILAFEPV